MTTNHTPAPWKILDQAPPFQIGIGTEKYTIAFTSVNVDRTLDEIQQANAKLIAAAPELLEALTKLYDFVIDPSVGLKVTGLDILVIKDRLDSAKQAITKATK